MMAEGRIGAQVSNDAGRKSDGECCQTQTAAPACDRYDPTARTDRQAPNPIRISQPADFSPK